ncbi:hypothetical protein P691DRAFT_734245 [Macrolepiota fuliginosa MF-IS2]|uniref:Uncharacterized protein n=1 Tax=Macrolepiota fuliginosa MF-IS2 TaxID=1400762 RepID=A0A9P5X880_9AGAR|nr:hypothetical protein P691DRAFT_734245 [Macrolepiota fuliginosa MF-IS2]
MSDPDDLAHGAPTAAGADKPGSTIGNRVKGAARLIHGFGEMVRGSVMSALDNAFSKGARGAEENGEITRQGRAEFERGLADVKGTSRRSSSIARPSSLHDDVLDQRGSNLREQ